MSDPFLQNIIDRSTLERWGNCPMQGRLCEDGVATMGSRAALSGQAVHDAISHVVSLIAAGQVWKAHDGRQELEQWIRTQAPPCVADDAWHAAMASAWPLCEFLTHRYNGEPRHPDDLLRFDGGKESRSGQLGWDLEYDDRTATLTCEVDILLATESPERVELIDWKSGRGEWTSTDVAQSFQLGTFYPVLIAMNYAGAKTISVRVWNMRTRSLTPAVHIPATEIPRRIDIITAALRLRDRYREGPLAKIPTHPDPDGCAICPVVRRCPVASEIAVESSDPAEMVRRLVVIDAKRADIAERCKAHVKDHGTIDAGDGLRFGAKPQSRPTYDYYKGANQ